MAAAPQYATFTFQGVSGQPYSIDAYLSDVDGAAVRFDSGAGSGTGSETFVTFPERVRFKDFSIKTGMTDTTFIRITVNGRATINALRYANHLNTLPVRPPQNLPIEKGSRFAAIQD